MADSISDKELPSVTAILEDPLAVWEKLKKKFTRRSEMGHEAAYKEFMHFAHDESETAEDTITRFEAIIDKCVNQEVEFKEHQLERQLLNKVNDRYNFLKKNYQFAKEKPDLEELFCKMRDDDFEYQDSNTTPKEGSAAFLNAVHQQA